MIFLNFRISTTLDAKSLIYRCKKIWKSRIKLIKLYQSYSANDFLEKNVWNIKKYFFNSRIIMIIMIKYIKNKRGAYGKFKYRYYKTYD